MTWLLPYTPLTEPFEHQREILQRSWKRPHWALCMEPGTGKSWIVIQTLALHYALGQLRGALIIAPNGVHENWEEQFALHLGLTVPLRFMAYRSSRRLAQELTLDNWVIEARDPQWRTIGQPPLWVVSMNAEAMSHPSGLAFAHRFIQMCRPDQAALIIDESHKFKRPGAKRTRAVLKLAEPIRLKRILSGTPTPHGLEDLYSQYRILDWKYLGHRTAASYRGEFCIEQKFARFSKIVGYKNITALNARRAPITSEIRLDECVDLPLVQGSIESHPTVIYVDLTDEQRKLYRDLVTQYHTFVRGGMVSAEEVITRMLRLQQITGGTLALDPEVEGGERELLTFPSAKLAAVVDLVESAGDSKVIVWCRFKAEVQLVHDALAKADIPSFMHSGDTTSADRKQIREEWKTSESRVLISTLSTGSSGFTLNEAQVAIFYSNWWGFEERLQAERRNLRIGQGKAVVYYDLVARGTIDAYILQTLQRKQSVSAMVRLNPRAALGQLLNDTTTQLGGHA